MFGKGGAQLSYNAQRALRSAGTGPIGARPRPEQFPVEARGRNTSRRRRHHRGCRRSAIGEEIVRRLNKTDWNDQEDQWAL